MSDEEKRSLKDQLDRIERCLVGEPGMGHIGMVETQRDHGKRLTRLERAAVYACGAGAVLGALYKIATDWLPHA